MLLPGLHQGECPEVVERRVSETGAGGAHQVSSLLQLRRDMETLGTCGDVMDVMEMLWRQRNMGENGDMETWRYKDAEMQEKWTLWRQSNNWEAITGVKAKMQRGDM